MMGNYHLLRPWWLLALLPWMLLLWHCWRKNASLQSWEAVCDPHLLAHLINSNKAKNQRIAVFSLFISMLCMIFALTGPAWVRLPVPAWQVIMPRVVVLDLSDSMLNKDVTPDRLTRARFKLHDLFARTKNGQSGLIVYTGEPFVVAPLTEDAETLNALLPTLNPEIMPVSGQRLDSALTEAGKLIRLAGFSQGQILVLTGTPPDAAAVDSARELARAGISTSVIPVLADSATYPLFQPLSRAGRGQLIPLTKSAEDLDKWMNASLKVRQTGRSENKDIPLWRDEGRWFLLPALLFLAPVFRRGWLQRTAL